MRYRFIAIIVFLCSCASQSRFAYTEQLLQTAKNQSHDEQSKLENTAKKVNEKSGNGEIDPVIRESFEKVLTKLNSNIDSLQKSIRLLEEFASSKSNFRENNYYKYVAPQVAVLDSFTLLKQKREVVYQLVQEAIDFKAFNLYNMAAFFGPGVYNIPASASLKIKQMFAQALDSLASLSNKYREIPRTARLVFVGYADEAPIAEGSTLYQNLSKFSTQHPVARPELNRILSQLRANEMMRNMKTIISEKKDFASSRNLRFSYFNYGRGEAYPSPKITDYKPQDERRRIVMFYWAVLPELSYLN